MSLGISEIERNDCGGAGMAEKTIMVQKLSIACENRFGGIQET